MPNGTGRRGVPRLVHSALRSAPRGKPYHMNEPSSRRGPSHIFRMMFASASVNAPQSPADDPTSALGSYLQRFGSSMTPSFTPSMESQAATAAATAASSLHGAIGLFAAFMMTGPHMCWMWKRFQLIAGAPDTTPLKSCGYRCTSDNPWRPPVEQPLKYE